MCAQRVAFVSHCISSLFVIVALHKLFVFPTIIHIGIKKYRETKNCSRIHKRITMSLKFWKFSTVFMFRILNYIIAAYSWWSSAAQWHQIVTGPYFNSCLSALELVFFFLSIIHLECISKMHFSIGTQHAWIRSIVIVAVAVTVVDGEFIFSVKYLKWIENGLFKPFWWAVKNQPRKHQCSHSVIQSTTNCFELVFFSCIANYGWRCIALHQTFKLKTRFTGESVLFT